MEKILASNSMKGFSCIGGECETSCCKGWNINIDEATYNLYMTAKDDKVVNFTENIILYPEESRSKYKYARFKQNNGNCSILDEKGLCKIHSRYGVRGLSNVCNTYPRIVNVENGEYEIAWSISCPEVVRFMMGETSPIFERVKASQYLDGVFALGEIYEQNNYTSEWQYALPEIREIIMDISIDKKLNITEKIIKIGYFIKNIQDEVNKKHLIFLPKRFLENFSQENYLSKILIENEKEYFSYLFSICEKRASADREYSNFISKFQEEIDYSFIAFPDFEKNTNKRYINFLENFLQNFILQNLFPLSDTDNILPEYNKLVISYSLLVLHLNYLMLNHEEIEEQYFIDMVVNFSRYMEHDQNFMAGIYENFQEYLKKYM